MVHVVRNELKQRELALEPGSAIDAGYLPRALCLASLPIKRPENQGTGNVSEYERKGERCILKLTTQHFHMPGTDIIIPVDVPYGREPRLLTLWLFNQRVQGRGPYIEIGSIKEWVAALGIAPNKTRLASLKKQLISLSLTNFTAYVKRVQGESEKVSFQQLPLIEQAIVDAEDMMHFGAGRFEKIRWPDALKLSQSFWDEDNLVPIPMHCLRPIAHSATAIDIFAYLCYRLPLIPRGESELLTFRQMNEQFGTGSYRTNPNRFATHYGNALKLALDAYPGANVEREPTGFRLRRSDPMSFAQSFHAVKLPRVKSVKRRRIIEKEQDVLL